jgi:thiamine transport system permease protein
MLAACGCTVCILLCAVFVVPAVAAFSPVVAADGFFSSVGIKPARVVHAALFTLKQAACSTFLAVCIGVPAAFFLARRNFPGRRLLASLATVPLCLPPLLVALGYVLFFGMQGTLNSVLMQVFGFEQPPVRFLYSFTGIVLAHGFYDFPIVMRTCASVWERLPPDESDAARMLGASEFRVFRTVTLRQLGPSIASSSMLVFLYCFFSFVIVLLFGSIGGTTLEVEIYQAARSSLDFRSAAILALAETTLAVAMVSVYAWLEKCTAKSTGMLPSGSQLPRQPIHAVPERIAALFFFAGIALFFLFPLLNILLKSFQPVSGYTDSFPQQFSATSYATLFSRKSFRQALANTLCVGVGSAILSASAAFAFSCAVRLNDPLGKRLVFRILPLLPLAVSSIVIGFGMTLLVPRGNPAMLVLAQSALAWPFALKQISGSMDRIPRNSMEAAALLSPNPLHTVFRICLPMCRRGIISALAFSFSISCGDATLPLVLAIPRFDTLSLMTYRLAGSYRFSEACACGIVLALLTAGVFFAGDSAEQGVSGE